MSIVVLPFTAAHSELLRDLLAAVGEANQSRVSVFASTVGDLTAHGLRFSPDVDAAMRVSLPEPPAATASAIADEIRAYGIDDDWFGFDDRGLAAALVRSRLLGLGYAPGQISQAMRSRFGAGHEVLPLTEQGLEAHTLIDSPEGRIARHVRHHEGPGEAVISGLDRAKAAPGLLTAIRQADAVLLPVSPAEAPLAERLALDAALALPGVGDALGGTRAAVRAHDPSRVDVAAEKFCGVAELLEAADEAARRRAEDSAGSLWGAS